MKKIITAICLLSISSTVFAATSLSPSEKQLKEEMALKFAEISRCDRNLKLEVTDSFLDQKGNTIVMLSESTTALSGAEYGIIYTRFVRFSNSELLPEAVGEINLSACSK